jgi:DNA-binding response OmpR family regulator
MATQSMCFTGGVQLCSKVRSFAKHATIIGVTGESSGVAVSDFLLNGADIACLKPLTLPVLNEIFAIHSFANDTDSV